MTFVHPILLAGLALVGIPVLLHLIMRQQPKHVRFPAMRFLLQQHRTNQRKLRLRHLLLLALRVLLLAAFVLALARPKIFSDRLLISTDRPVAAVLVFDTSLSMEYAAGGKTRLEEAKRRSLELLDELPGGSRVAVLDTAEPGGEWLVSLSQARERINALEPRAANYPVTAQLLPAYDLFAKLEEEADVPDEIPLRFLYFFSDRTQACWANAQLDQARRRLDQFPPNTIRSIFVDVGVDNPAAVAVANLEVPKQVVPANETVSLRATVQATGAACDTEVVCRIDGKAPGDRKPVRLDAGQSRVVTFERKNLTPGFHQAEVFLATPSGLPWAGARYATFEVQGPRQVLTVTDDVGNAVIWKLALEVLNFKCDVKSTEELRRNLFPKELEKYKAVCLLDVARPDKECWDKLAAYVRAGGGLAVVPGNEMEVGAYNAKEAQELLPGRLVKMVTGQGRGAVWSALTYQHPVMAKFGEWSKNENTDIFLPGNEPAAKRYWEVEPSPNQGAYVIVSYGEKKPALLERNFDRAKVRGRVLLFTSPMDDRNESGPVGGRANTYLEQNSFYLALIRETLGYLAGGVGEGTFNYQSGQTVPVPLPATPRFPTYTLQGPGVSPGEGVVPREEGQNELRITKAVAPGNYKVFGGDNVKAAAGFSVNATPDECQLGRVPVEQIEGLLGEGAVLPVDHKTTFHDALQNHWNQPVELLPWLMILVLLVLVVENFLGNKFYRREPEGHAKAG